MNNSSFLIRRSLERCYLSWSTCNQMVCQHQMILRTFSWENLPPFLLNQQPIKCFHFSQVDVRQGTDEGMVSTKPSCPQSCCGHLFWGGCSFISPLGYKQEVLLWGGGWISWAQNCRNPYICITSFSCGCRKHIGADWPGLVQWVPSASVSANVALCSAAYVSCVVKVRISCFVVCFV